MHPTDRRSKNKNMHAVTLLAALGLFYQPSALAKCIDDWLAVDQVRDGDSIELRATNQQDFPITYSVRVRSESLSAGRTRVRGTLDGGESESLAQVPGEATDLSVSCSWTIGDDESSHDDDYLYQLPYAEGTSYRVLQGFGSRFSHRGIEQYAIDFKMSVGTPVHAARGGIVARVVESNDKGCWEDGCGRYANFIVVMHDDGTTGEYYHLQQDGALVDVGDTVVAGQKIGLSGNTGHSALPHLHFAVYRATRSGLPQSVPISFVSADGIVYRPRQGHHYQAVTHINAGD
jgi:murein DD-endopeptidase MepM/ murein hydrolase activator NlpD